MGDCRGFIGLDESELRARLGRPSSRRAADDDIWLLFRAPGLTLRARCTGPDGAPARVASWTASFAEGYATLAEAARAVGLWPDAAPDVAADTVGAPLIRRSLPSDNGDSTFSFTATVRARRITQVSVFDEPPDWR